MIIKKNIPDGGCAYIISSLLKFKYHWSKCKIDSYHSTKLCSLLSIVL